MPARYAVAFRNRTPLELFQAPRTARAGHRGRTALERAIEQSARRCRFLGGIDASAPRPSASVPNGTETAQYRALNRYRFVRQYLGDTRVACGTAPKLRRDLFPHRLDSVSADCRRPSASNLNYDRDTIDQDRTYHAERYPSYGRSNSALQLPSVLLETGTAGA